MQGIPIKKARKLSKEHLRTQKDKVEYCLLHYSWTRDNDIDLLRAVRQQFYRLNTLYVSKDDMKRLPTQESIKRIRARFNSKGMYYPTKPEIIKDRGLNMEVYKQYYRENA